MTWLYAEDSQHIFGLYEDFYGPAAPEVYIIVVHTAKFTWLLHCWKAAEGYHLSENLARREVQPLSALFRNSEFHLWIQHLCWGFTTEISEVNGLIPCMKDWKEKKIISVSLVLYPVWRTVELMSLCLEKIWGAIELTSMSWGQKVGFLECDAIRLLTYIKNWLFSM